MTQALLQERLARYNEQLLQAQATVNACGGAIQAITELLHKLAVPEAVAAKKEL